MGRITKRDWISSDLRPRVAKALENRSPSAYLFLRRGLQLTRRLRGRAPVRISRPLADVTSLPGKAADRNVVVLAMRGDRRAVLRWLMQFHGDRVHVLSPDATLLKRESGASFTHHRADSLDEVDDVLKVMRPVDVIVDLTAGSIDAHLATWRRLFFHLSGGGIYVLDRSAVRNARFRPGLRTWMSAISPADGNGSAPAGWRNHASATANVTLSRSLFIIGKRGKHFLKLRDAEANRVLPAREPSVGVTELAALPAGQLRSAARVISHESAVPIRWLPDQMSYPTHHLRHYTGRIAFYGSTLFCTNRSILPDSFRWHLEPIPRNPKIRSMSPTFARLKVKARPRETLEGHYYNLDPQYSGHFGHIMTEVVGRLWGWDQAKRQIPELKAIFRVDAPARHGETVQRRLLRAYGIADDDIVVVDHPVHLESLVSATVMWHNADPHYTHPMLRDVWDRLRTNLADPDAPVYERIFVSRAETFWRRSCRNVRAVEELFASHGFTVIHPEQLDLAVQVGIFSTARVVAGFGGSALFNVMYATKLECLIVLNHEAYIARNEHLYTALLGGDVHYFWSPPDVPQPAQFTSGADHRWSGDAFVSGWEFDFARNQEPLEQLLRTL